MLLGWTSPRAPLSHLLKTHFNIILPSTCRFYKWPTFRGFPQQNRVRASLLMPTIRKQFNIQMDNVTAWSVDILAGQLIKMLVCTCHCAGTIRSESNLANNYRSGVQISTPLPASERIMYNVKNFLRTQHLSIVLSIPWNLLERKRKSVR